MKRDNLVACTIDLTEGCNLACDYCFTYSKHKKRVLPLDLGKRIIDWWLPQTDPTKHIQMSFWGGEPLLEFERMKKLIAHANELNKDLKRDIEYGGTTNGVLYTPDKVEWCAENRSLFLISLDGVKAAHDMHRKFPNGKGSFDIVIKNLKEALKIAPMHQIRFSISVDTIPYFFETIQFMVEELGIKNCAFSPVFEDQWLDGDYLDQMSEQFDLAIEYGIKHLKRGEHIRMKHLDDEARMNNKIMDRVPNPCGAGNFYMGWGVDGYGWPCHRFNKHGISTDVRAKSPLIIARPTGDSFEWCNEEWINSFRTFSEKMKGKCLDCDLYARSSCAGGCYATNLDLTGSIYKPAAAECAYNHVLHAAGLRYAKRMKEEGVELPQTFNRNMQKNVKEDKCVCYNMCYAEGTKQEIIHKDARTGMACHCYQTAYTGNYPATPLSEKRAGEEMKKRFLELSKRILATQDEPKTEEERKMEQEILKKTSEML